MSHPVRQTLSAMKKYVFVYGTLKTGQPNHGLMIDRSGGVATLVGIGRTSDKYPLIITTRYNIPYMLNKPGLGEHIIGEVYEVDGQMLATCDKLERHPEHYQRSNIQVNLIPENCEAESQSTAEGNQSIECMAYLINNFKPHLLDLEFYDEYLDECGHGLKYVKPQDRKAPVHDPKLDVLNE